MNHLEAAIEVAESSKRYLEERPLGLQPYELFVDGGALVVYDETDPPQLCRHRASRCVREPRRDVTEYEIIDMYVKHAVVDCPLLHRPEADQTV